MSERTSFPTVFWVANPIEVLERFAYYGIYFGFGIYMASLGYSRSQLGIVQSLFLLLSYVTPVISGTFADRYGFKKVLIVSYLAYLPSILLLIFTKSFSGIVLTMLSHRPRRRDLQAARLGHGAGGDRQDQQDPRLRHLLRDGQRRGVVRADRGRPAAGHLLGLRLHRPRRWRSS